jgi:hypothetical protein
MLKVAATHLVASLACAAWALLQFQAFHLGTSPKSLTGTLAEWAFAVMSWPLIPLFRVALHWQLRQGSELLLLAAALALNSLLWGKALSVLGRRWRKSRATH